MSKLLQAAKSYEYDPPEYGTDRYWQERSAYEASRDLNELDKWDRSRRKYWDQNYFNKGGEAMYANQGRYAISGHLPMPQQQSGPLGMIGNSLINRGLQAGMDAYLPGSGTLMGGVARDVLPGIVPRFNEGGKLGSWMGWGPTLQAYADAAKYYGGKAKDAMPEITREDVGLDPASLALAKKFWKNPIASTKGAMGYNQGGSIHPQEKAYQMEHKNHLTGVTEYKQHGGKVGPLSKTVMKDKDGNSSERHYHNPLMAQNKPTDK